MCIKINQPIILLRNINPNEGLCNGTRLIITKVFDRILEAKIALGLYMGKTVLYSSDAVNSFRNKPTIQFSKATIPN